MSQKWLNDINCLYNKLHLQASIEKYSDQPGYRSFVLYSRIAWLLKVVARPSRTNCCMWWWLCGCDLLVFFWSNNNCEIELNVTTLSNSCQKTCSKTSSNTLTIVLFLGVSVNGGFKSSTLCWSVTSVNILLIDQVNNGLKYDRSCVCSLPSNMSKMSSSLICTCVHLQSPECC